MLEPRLAPAISVIGFRPKSSRMRLLYCRFDLAFRDIEELLASKGVIVSFEAVRP